MSGFSTDLIRPGQAYRLQHLASGKYLSTTVAKGSSSTADEAGGSSFKQAAGGEAGRSMAAGAPSTEMASAHGSGHLTNNGSSSSSATARTTQVGSCRGGGSKTTDPSPVEAVSQDSGGGNRGGGAGDDRDSGREVRGRMFGKVATTVAVALGVSPAHHEMAAEDQDLPPVEETSVPSARLYIGCAWRLPDPYLAEVCRVLPMTAVWLVSHASDTCRPWANGTRGPAHTISHLHSATHSPGLCVMRLRSSLWIALRSPTSRRSPSPLCSG